MPQASTPGGQGDRETVLLDANVLMSRVQRDYFLYAASEGVVDVKWSPDILREMNRNLVAKRDVPQQGADKLENLLSEHFPGAKTEPRAEHFAAFADVAMPDPDDRHVLAAAVASDASVLCTNNVKDFPDPAMDRVGIARQQPDAVLDRLIRDHPEAMSRVHQTTTDRNPRATSESTLQALQNSGAPKAASRMDQVLRSAGSGQETQNAPATEAQRLAGMGFAKPAGQATQAASGPATPRARGHQRGPGPGHQR